MAKQQEPKYFLNKHKHLPGIYMSEKPGEGIFETIESFTNKRKMLKRRKELIKEAQKKAKSKEKK